MIKKEKAKADKAFSLFIRKRDAKNGGKCITCNKWFPYEEMDAGHFVSRNCIALRYDEQNVNAQCRGCNRFRGGEQALYAKALDKKYGEGTSDSLLKIYKISRAVVQRYPASFYLQKYEEYKEKNKEV